MRTIIAIAVLMFLQAPAPSTGDIFHFQWMRNVAIGPAPKALTCAVVPPALFHEAAPSLRDVRLFAKNREIPFAQEESYDEQSLMSGVTQASDRSFFDTVIASPTTTQNGKQVARFHLPAKIPIERISLAKPATHDLPLQIHARIINNPSLSEDVSGKILKGEQVFPVTLGANLQQDAIVEVDIQTEEPLQLALQMRRRWLCFEPIEGVSSMQLFYGDPSLPGPGYKFATALTMPEHPTMAILGPQQNLPRHSVTDNISRYRLRLLLTLGAVILLLPLAGIALFTKQQRRR